MSVKNFILKGLMASLLGSLLFIGGCDCNGPVIVNKESFMLAYIDTGERIRVRYSNDGLTWQSATLQGGIADANIGTASSDDAVGSVRLMGHNGNVAKLHVRYGIGADVWDNSDIVYDSEPTPRGEAPRIACSATNRWLFTNLGGSNGYTPTVRLYNSSSKTFSDVSPTAQNLNMGNLVGWRAPSIITMRTRVLLGYLRFSGIGDVGTLADMQIMQGVTDASGVPAWSNASTFNVQEPGFGPPQTIPAFAHDHTNIYLAVVRKSISNNSLRLFIYASPDGSSWQLSETLDQVPQVSNPVGLRIGIAAHSNGTKLVMFTGGGAPKMYRTTGSGWNEVPAGNVFGSNTPNWYRFSLIAAGRPPTQ